MSLNFDIMLQLSSLTLQLAGAILFLCVAIPHMSAHTDDNLIKLDRKLKHWYQFGCILFLVSIMISIADTGMRLLQ